MKDAILSLFLVILHSFFSQWYKVLKRELEVKTDFNSHSARKAQRNCGCSIRFQLLLLVFLLSVGVRIDIQINCALYVESVCVRITKEC